MTIYGQTLGVFKRENDECIRNGEKANLHKIKIEVFLTLHMWCHDPYFVTNYVIMTSYAVIPDEIHVIAPHMLSPKNYNFDFMQICIFSLANTFIVFPFKYP